MANPFSPRQYGELHRVTDRVYIFRNITNSSFVVGDRSVAVIDTQVNWPSAERLLATIRSVTDKPIRHVINTHYHWDHTNGNGLFKNEGAAVVSSKLTKDFMVDRAPRQKEFLAGRGFELGHDPLLPDVTFEGETSIDPGGVPMRVFFAGTAESDDASAVYLPTEGVLMSGDTVMTGSFPIFGQPVWDEGLQGDGEWQATIAKLMALKPRHIIPGHGPLAGEKEVDLLLRIQNYFVDAVRPLAAKGLSAGQVLAELEPKLPGWITSVPLVWGTPRYAILRVYRGLIRQPLDAEPGWQVYKPSVIPVKEVRLAGKETPEDFQKMAEEAKEGGDRTLEMSILRKGVQVFPDAGDLAAACADALIEASRGEASVLEKGDYFQEARTLWDRTLAKRPDHLASLIGKGRYWTMMAYRGGDDPRPGMALLDKALSLKPSGRLLAETEFYLGMGHRRLGDEKAAKAAFARARQADASFMPALLAAQV